MLYKLYMFHCHTTYNDEATTIKIVKTSKISNILAYIPTFWHLPFTV